MLCDLARGEHWFVIDLSPRVVTASTLFSRNYLCFELSVPGVGHDPDWLGWISSHLSL